MNIQRIAITGPESTGKSTLCEQLAQYYHTVWNPEFARTYLNQINRPYEQNDLLLIAQGQIESEQLTLLKASNFLFCDTEPINIKIWSEHRFLNCHNWIINAIETFPYDLYLLCNIDLPWQYDPLREHPHMRQYFFDLFLKELEARHLPYTIISGTSEERANNAIKAIDCFFGK